MDDKIYKITLADGTVIDNLKLNGNNFISPVEIDETIFDGNCLNVTINDGEKDDVHTNMELVQITKMGEEYEQYTVPQGYHDGSGKVGIVDTEKEKLVPANIREGITLLGVEGTMSGTEDAKPQAKTVTPKTTEQTVLPDTEEGYNYLSQVTVAAIPYQESENPAGGTTVTIG